MPCLSPHPGTALPFHWRVPVSTTCLWTVALWGHPFHSPVSGLLDGAGLGTIVLFLDGPSPWKPEPPPDLSSLLQASIVLEPRCLIVPCPAMVSCRLDSHPTLPLEYGQELRKPRTPRFEELKIYNGAWV